MPKQTKWGPVLTHPWPTGEVLLRVPEGIMSLHYTHIKVALEGKRDFHHEIVWKQDA